MKQFQAAPRSEDETLPSLDRLFGCGDAASNTQSSYRIGDLAQEFDISLRTLRFYEDRGLLAPQRLGTTRLYSRRDRKRLRLILLAKLLGFSLTEAKQMIELYDLPDGERRQLETALVRFEEQEKVLVDQRRELDEALTAMTRSLAVVRHRLSSR